MDEYGAPNDMYGAPEEPSDEYGAPVEDSYGAPEISQPSSEYGAPSGGGGNLPGTGQIINIPAGPPANTGTSSYATVPSRSDNQARPRRGKRSAIHMKK